MMEYRKLGSTDIIVSRLCFGSLTISPLQANLDFDDGAKIINEALDLGINFIDTAELYNNYEYIKRGIKNKRSKVVISTKSYAYSKESAEKSLLKALKEIDTDYIDIFSLHEQESEHTIRGHYEAIEYLIKAKEKGLIRAIGISTHAVAAVEAANKYGEIEVLHPIVNKAGLGIIDGNIEEMLKAIEIAHNNGKGIYSMKPLGGGNLIKIASECFKFVLQNPYIDSVAVGMQSMEEVLNNILIFEGTKVPEDISEKLSNKKRRLLIDFWCKGCGECVKACSQKALKVVEGKAVVEAEKCLLCGYCSAYCSEFCIKIV
jgi:aryl-alcohol dehydrogenase-like predicted oxidoreductase